MEYLRPCWSNSLTIFKPKTLIEALEVSIGKYENFLKHFKDSKIPHGFSLASIMAHNCPLCEFFKYECNLFVSECPLKQKKISCCFEWVEIYVEINKVYSQGADMNFLLLWRLTSELIFKMKKALKKEKQK